MYRLQRNKNVKTNPKRPNYNDRVHKRSETEIPEQQNTGIWKMYQNIVKLERYIFVLFFYSIWHKNTGLERVQNFMNIIVIDELYNYFSVVWNTGWL